MLTEKHSQELQASCISSKIIKANFESVEGQSATERLLGLALGQIKGDGQQYATKPVQRLQKRYEHIEKGGWWVSGVDPRNNWEVMEWGQLKPDNPREDTRKTSKVIKYETPPKTEARALFLRGGCDWPEVVKEGTLPILITEGAKKAACALSCGINAISLQGVNSGYRVKDSEGNSVEPHLIPDVELFAAPERPVLLAFDQDENPKTRRRVVKALTKFGALLEAKGCEVYIVEWSSEQGKGIDDLVANCGPQSLRFAVNNAKPIEEWKELRSQSKDAKSSGDEPKVNRLKKSYHAVEALWGENLAFNEYTKEIELNGKSVEIAKARLQLAVEHNLLIGLDNLEAILMNLAECNNYHPVRNYLKRCEQQHDGFSMLENLSRRYFGTTESIYDAYLKRTLIGAVARIFEPGCKFDNALILQGCQGIGKSTFFKILAGGDDYFDDSLGAASDKDERLKLHQSWILEWAELESIFKRKDIAQTKAFITSSVDNVRPPYGRQAVRMARQSIIVGSTNQDEFLSDSTGNRRFWVIPVQGAIDLELLRAERDQIWAAAVAAYRAGEKPFLSLEERSQAAEAVKDYQTSDPWQSRIEAYLLEGHLSVVTTTDILNSCLKLDVQQQGRREQMRVADILKTLGWRREKVTYLGKRRWGYVKPEPLLKSPAQSEEESCDRNNKKPPLTDEQLCNFMDWNLDQPDRYQTELAKLSTYQVDYLYQRLPELRPLQEGQRCLATTT